MARVDAEDITVAHPPRPSESARTPTPSTTVEAGGAPFSPVLDHTAYALYTVRSPRAGGPRCCRLRRRTARGRDRRPQLAPAPTRCRRAVTTIRPQLPPAELAPSSSRRRRLLRSHHRGARRPGQRPTSFQLDWSLLLRRRTSPPPPPAWRGSVWTPPTPRHRVGGRRDQSAPLTAAIGASTAPKSSTSTWRRCDSGGGACADIVGAAGARYTGELRERTSATRCTHTRVERATARRGRRVGRRRRRWSRSRPRASRRP